MKSRQRRRSGRRGRGRSNRPPTEPRSGFSLLRWLKNLFSPAPAAPSGRPTKASLTEQETRVIAEFSRHYSIQFRDPGLLKLALTHRSYLSVTGQGPRESNERLEFLGDSVLGLVTSEHLYLAHPNEHEGQLTKTKSLLVSKAILSRRALAMGLGRFVLMSHSEIESGGRQRLSILADAFESVIGAIYLDQGFEVAREFIVRWLLRDTGAIVADKRHTNYKSHLQEYVQSTFRTHPIYRIRSEMGPDHSKMFNVEVIVGRRVLGSGRGRNKKEAEQSAARNALEQVETGDRSGGEERPERVERHGRGERSGRGESSGRSERPARRDEAPEDVGAPVSAPLPPAAEMPESEIDEFGSRPRRGRRGGRGRRGRHEAESPEGPALGGAPQVEEEAEIDDIAPPPSEPQGARATDDAERPATPWRREPGPRPQRLPRETDDFDEVGRPEGPLEERHVDPYAWDPAEPPTRDVASGTGGRSVNPLFARPRVESSRRPERESEVDEGAERGEGMVTEEGQAPAKPAESTGPTGPATRDPARSFGRRPGRRR